MRQLVIIGMDGATLSVADPWMDAGLLPNLARIRDEGVIAPLESVILPVSGPAWASFMTGKNPGKHGIYDFLKRLPGRYERRVMNSSDIDAPALWEIVSDHGGRVAVVNVPGTYPPRRVNGVLVSGMLTPSTDVQFTWPPDFARELQEEVGAYRLSVTGGTISPGKEGEFIADVMDVLDQRDRTLQYLLQREPYDLVMFVFFETDVMQHKFWGHMEDPQNPWRDALLQTYQRVDTAIGHLLDLLDDDVTLMVVSDHGGGRLKKHLLLNRWLMDQGFLHLKQTPAARFKCWLGRHNPVLKTYDLLKRIGLAWVSRLVPRKMRLQAINAFFSFDDIDWERTVAYSAGHFGQIFINLKGREPHGCVEPGEEYERVREAIAARLYEITDPETGEPIVDRVYKREELYHGPYLDEPPDLVLMMKDMLYVTSSDQMGWDAESIFADSVYGDTGTHRLHGLFLAKGPGIRQGVRLENASLMDVAPTALYAMGLPVPNDLDGQVLEAIFTPEFWAQNPPRYVEPQDFHKGEHRLSAAEARQVEERLRNLGYLN